MTAPDAGIDLHRTYSLAEAATFIGCTEQWLTRQLITQRLPGYKAARKWRMTAGDIEAAINICRQPQATAGITPVVPPVRAGRVRWSSK